MVFCRFLDPILTVVFPGRCPACRGAVSSPLNGPLCAECWETLPRHRQPLCTCGLPLGAPSLCGRCRRGLNPIAAGASLGPYEGSLRTLIHELKYAGHRRVAARLAEALLQVPQTRRVLAGGVVLIPVPLHPRRRRHRGFNQSELLARELARRVRLPTVVSALVRRKDTPPQTGLSATARRGNVRGAFAVRRRPRIEGRVVVLVDDVVTTGATAFTCAQVLKREGAKEVRLLTAARVC